MTSGGCTLRYLQRDYFPQQWSKIQMEVRGMKRHANHAQLFLLNKYNFLLWVAL